MSRDMCAAAVRPANMRRPEMHPTAAACPDCRQVHMINPRTGKVLGTDEE
jgi:hypothetical protein